MTVRRHGLGRRARALGAALLIYTAAVLAAAPASAIQVLDAVDHAELSAEVSAAAVSRIALEADRIVRVIGAPEGFETEHDPARGDLYLRPLDAGFDPELEPEPAALFIGTEKGFTYRLTLTVAERGAAQILIRNAAGAIRPAESGTAPGDARVAALVRLIGAVARREPLPGYAIAPGGAGRDGGLEAVEIWRGPQYEALVLEIGDAAPGDAAGLAALLPPGIAAAWLGVAETGPNGGRLAVVVRARPGAAR